MKSTVFLAAAFAALTASAQDLPQPSPVGEVEQIVGLTKVEVDYSRPSAKGRTVFGDVVPFGKLWRTGANLNTTIEFSGPVKFGGQDVAAGKYSVFTVPGKETWVIHLNKKTDLWGEDGFEEASNVASVKIPAGTTEFTETMTFEFANLNADNADLVLRWENTKVVVPIVTDATEQGVANIKEALSKADAKAGAYGSSARFCLDRQILTKESLEWAKKSVDMDKKFWTMHTLARAQAANGMTKEAIATAEESMKMAQEANNEAYVKMNRDRIEEWKKSGK